MITDCYDIATPPLMSLRDFYGEPGHAVERCLITFSEQLHRHLLEHFHCEKLGVIGACNGSRDIYKMNYKGTELAFYLSTIGSGGAVSDCEVAAWVTGARSFIMFGSCGSLDGEATRGRFVVPTESYRGEGASYYYAPPADYIKIKNSATVARLLGQLGVPFIEGRVWTTDCFGRETRGLVEQRRREGCIAVEMEVAGVQAACDFNGYELYDFLEPGDVLADSGYELEDLDGANHDTAKLYLALELARQI